MILLVIFPAWGICSGLGEKIVVAEDVELVQVTPNVYVHVSYKHFGEWGLVGANGVLIVNNGKAFLLDSPWSNEQTEKLIRYVEDTMKVEIIGFIPNHWHDDCMGGLDYIKQKGIKSYANQMTFEYAAKAGLPLPDVGFKNKMELKLGDVSLYCYYPGAAHSMDNIVVWIPSEKVLFPGCMVKSAGARNLGNTSDGDVKAYATTLKKVKNQFKDAEIVIPGHGSWGGTELIDNTKRLAIQK